MYLNSNSRLNQVLEVFKKIEANQVNHFKEEFIRHHKNIKMEVNKCVIMTTLQEIYSPYAIKMLEQRISKSISYRSEQVRSNQW